ncbi:hypothetical protein M2341_000057 [Sphingobium sp. B7D2B]|uniref:hypothetical protein n=1 Tax=Sphingobium sp. B7D2B TaxID=2940583 RepID=UPI0022252A6B|nr:hypothetical protein [Sphingobium sp. B7D2B]MCW2364610.1 hypothetical protein [Sphingobium sp. B7D2B]
MTIRAKLGGIEQDINDIEPIIREIDTMTEQILALVQAPGGQKLEAGMQHLPKLKACYDALVDRIEIVRLWNEQEERDFVESMRRFALDWKIQRP